MGALRSVRRTFVAGFFALLLGAAGLAAAGPVSGSVGPEPVKVRSVTVPMRDLALSLQGVWDARLAHTLMVFGDSTPFSASSPTKHSSANRSSSISCAVAIMPSAIGRSKLGPSFFTSAGARLIVVRPRGQ